MGMIDTHVHLYDGGWPPNSPMGLSNQKMLAVMDEMGIEEVWISPVSALIGNWQKYNEDVYEFTKIAPRRMRNFYVVNPNDGEVAVQEIHRLAKEKQACGIKLHPWLQAFSVSYDCTYRVIQACAEENLPILFHDGTPPYSDSLQIAVLAEKFPKAKIILGHAGLLDGVSSAIHAAQRYKNIYLCLCGPTIGDVRKIVAKVDADRILYGSDGGTGISRDSFYQRIQIIKQAVNAETAKQILEENPRKLIP